MAQSFGMKQADGKALQQNPAQVLGTNPIDVTHLAAAYAGFAARGQYCTPVAITDVTTATGEKIKVPKSRCSKAVDPEIADEVTKILEGVIQNGTGRGGGIGRPAAGKTGTCEAHSCALFAGYTPDLAAAVWYGDYTAPFGNNSPGIYGADIGRIWQASMRGALANTSPSSFHQPVKDITNANVADVPDVTGLPLAQAKQKLQAAGFTVQVSPRAIDSNQNPGTVAYTSPGPGAQADQNSPIMIFVSNGGNGGNGNPPNGTPPLN